MTTQRLTPQAPAPQATKPYKGLAMEGMIATWYAKNTKQGREFETLASQLRTRIPAGSHILEVAPGPGYLAIELAKDGAYAVTGLDISKSFVEIAQANAQQAGVSVDFQQGNASAMPFADATFDFVVCCAAFKNFTEPVAAIEEMARVLQPGGQALINDLRKDASLAEIDAHIAGMGMNWLNRLFTQFTFRQILLKNAYTPADICAFVAQTSFGHCTIDHDGIGMAIWFKK